MIKIKKLNYNNLINNFNLEVNNNITCLIGPSGCGKTTLFKILINQITDYSGDVNTQNCAYLPQNNLLLDHLTVKANLELITKNNVDDYITRFNLDPTSYPNELSGGMKSKLSIIRTLVMERDTILFDEPFTGIDILTKYDLLPWLKEQLKGKDVLYITHDIHEALTISDNIVLVDGSMNIIHVAKTTELSFEEIIKILNTNQTN